MKQRLLLIILSLFVGTILMRGQIGTTFNVTDSDGNEITYEITSENTVMYKGVDGYGKKGQVVRIEVPETMKYNGKVYKVTELAPGCFFYYTELKEVILPNSITTLLPSKSNVDGGYLGTFDACYELRNIVLPENLKIIGGKTFASCKTIKEIKIPESVEDIGDAAFISCESLTSLVFPNNVKKVGGGCLAYCGSLKSVILPNEIKELNTYAPNSDNHYGFFKGCTSLESIDLPASITKIGNACFEGCTNLKRIVIPDEVENLPAASWYYGGNTFYYGTFSNCSSLEEVVLSKKLKDIGYQCFSGCTKLQKVVGLNSSIELRINTARELSNFYKTYDITPFSGSGFEHKLDSVKRTFSFSAEPVIRKKIEEWQKKKEYETTAQWQSRVTEISRQAKVEELLEQQQKEYITNHTPQKFSGTIGNYDDDYNAFPVKVKDMNMIFIKVPSDVASEFKEKWDKFSPKATPVYGVVDNNIAVLSCTFKFKGKEYGLAQTFKNDDAESLALNLSPLDLNIGGENGSKTALKIDHSLDQNIPTVTPNSNTNTFAVIIGNEQYTQVAHVPYANNDARIFAEYCKKTLGVPIQNVRKYENVTFGMMLTALSDLKNIAEAYQGDINIIFYYAGHGIPNEQTHDAFLLPVDADGKQTEACYPVSRLYKELGGMGVKNVVVFMDACFSGAQRGEGMLASARGVAIKSKEQAPQGNMVVFSAATGDETAYPYNEKGHGLFTYFLLKKLNDTKGECTLGELGQYVQDNVRQQSVVVNRKSQTPTITPSPSIKDSWKNLKLK